MASIIHIEGWETAKDQDLRNLPATAYPVTICWVPLPDQSEDSLARNNREETAFTIDGEVFTLNQRMPSSPIERAFTPYKRRISEVTPRPEREEDDRQMWPTQQPNLAEERRTQDADALTAADALLMTETVALPQSEADNETGPTRRSQRQRKAPAQQ